MADLRPQKHIKTSSISNDIAAYIINKRNNAVSFKKPDINSEAQYYSAPLKSNPENLVKQNAPVKNHNVPAVNKTGDRKALEFQILFGELENVLLTMNVNDAMVQKALIKLNEIRTRVIPELKKIKE